MTVEPNKSDARPSSSQVLWEDVKQRLANLRDATSLAGSLSPEQAKQLMDDRARALAHAPEQSLDERNVLRVIRFRVVEQALAIEAHWLREVTLPDRITPLPGSPDFLTGLTNLRGEVLAVMDLRRLFGISTEQAPEDESVVLIIGGDRIEFGWQVDEVEGVKLLRLDELLEPPGSISGECRELLHGVTADGLLVIDGEALIKDERLYVDQK